MVIAHYDLTVFPNTQVAIKAAPFQTSFRILRSPNVPAFCRLTTSLRRGWRHFPGVREASGTGASTDTALGVDGADWDDIDICRKTNRNTAS